MHSADPPFLIKQSSFSQRSISSDRTECQTVGVTCCVHLHFVGGRKYVRRWRKLKGCISFAFLMWIIGMGCDGGNDDDFDDDPN
jgi:hypothetical protein